ncbi:hypothetical protein SORBI_3003G211900 [Sorghum bicolor]|uniref:F-box domain-containing protein n=1 Tax=Sorghum bicolor TaxID=4558 RepID=C5XQA6_SORBI|nr:hypothetical protein SORBI_3003G211900 [Sorghum bicolor]
MARDRSRTHSPPPVKRQKKSSTTTVASLADDILLEIFLRLPSLATLVRAALTCRGWRRAVASSPAFRRRFRETHPAPLLGLFFNPPGAVQDPALPAFPSFVPTRGTDRDQAAAVRGGDFFLTSLQERHGVHNGWGIHDCRGGYLLLANADQLTMAVTNPLARRRESFFDFGHEDTLEGHRVHAFAHQACLLCSDEDPTSFRVSRVRATVFSSDTGEWSVRPWVDIPARPQRGRFWLLNGNMQTNGFLYWVYKNCKYMVSLDAATMDFSVAELPVFLKNRLCSFVVGEMNNGEPCIVYAINFTVGVLLRRTDSDGVERWVLDRAEILETQLGLVLGKLMENYNEVQVVAVRDGFAYLATSERSNRSSTPSWFLSLCLETMKLEKLFWRTYDSFVQPYVMPWPPALVGNYGRFALEDGV